MTLFQVDPLATMFRFCSHGVKPTNPPFQPPWTLIRENSDCYVVRDANGETVAWLFCRDDSQRYSFGASKLTSDEARRIGKAISRIPEFMSQRHGFYAPEPNPETRKKDVVWFALNDDRPLFAFGGLWTEFKGDRGTKSKPIPGPHFVLAFSQPSRMRSLSRSIRK
jgi:hypothetical protein